MKTSLKKALSAAPFHLNRESLQWVDTTFREMTTDEKIGQLFCLIAYSSDPGFVAHMTRNLKIGGLMLRTMPLEECVSTVAPLQTSSKVPMLIAANFERGGNGAIAEGTSLGSPMEVAATSDDAMAWKLGTVCGREAAAIGANWAFAPIIDIDSNFRNPITSVRTFGSDPDRVKRLGVEYTKGCQAHGVAVSIKHFPGDGVDERDQHLVTSVNSLTTKQWDATYGAAYKASIDAGALTVMVGHIMQPAYSKKLNPMLADKDILPASLAPELLNGLLRKKLGFNGLIVSDATTMAGMVIPMPRSKAVPATIAAGCDIFLFTRNLEEDFAYMRQGVSDGTITEERLTEAVTRILGLKAALGLHTKKANGTLVPQLASARKVVGCAEHQAWAAECADKGITLVKEQPGVLPLTPRKYKNVLFYDLDSGPTFFNPEKSKLFDSFVRRLTKEGFTVDRWENAKGMEGMVTPYSAITEKYDLILYLAKMEVKSNQTVVRIEWAMPMGANCPIHLESVPTIFISLENPYHLLDVPRVKTFINAYHPSEQVLTALVDKLVGRSPFKGQSPVDSFLGRWDTRL